MKLFSYKIIFFFLFINFSVANENIRFININFIVNNSNAGKSLNKIIENKNNKIKSELKNLSNKLEEKKDKILSQKNILKKEEFDKLVKNYEVEVKNFNSFRNKKTEEFNLYRINSQRKIIDLMNPIIKDFLNKESIQILLQKDKIIFGDDKLDITNEILQIFDKKHKKIKFE